MRLWSKKNIDWHTFSNPKKSQSYCHNPILGYSLKNYFFQNKNQKIKEKAGNVEKAGREIKLQFLEEIQGLIVPHYTQKWRQNANSRLN
jgi:hypothetical protein